MIIINLLLYMNMMDCLAWLKEYIIDVWEIRKHKYYYMIFSLHLGRGMVSLDKLGHSCTNVTKGKLYGSWVSD